MCSLLSDWENKFDHVMCQLFIHDVGNPSLALREILRVLKPGSYFSMQEINLHSNVKDNLGNIKSHFFDSLGLGIYGVIRI